MKKHLMATLILLALPVSITLANQAQNLITIQTINNNNMPGINVHLAGDSMQGANYNNWNGATPINFQYNSTDPKLNLVTVTLTSPNGYSFDISPVNHCNVKGNNQILASNGEYITVSYIQSQSPFYAVGCSTSK